MESNNSDDEKMKDGEEEEEGEGEQGDNGSDEEMEDEDEEEGEEEEEEDAVPTSQPKFKVESYFINVGGLGGDSAIHALIDTKPSENDNPKGEIVSLVLIDGGVSGREVNIKEALDYIRKRYGDPTLGFDSIVITHWDNDHYGGVLGLLSSGIDVYDDDSAKEGIVRCEYLNYYIKDDMDEEEEEEEGTGDEDAVEASLATTLYCPSEFVEGLIDRVELDVEKGLVRSLLTVKKKKDGKEEVEDPVDGEDEDDDEMETVSNPICKLVTGKKAIGCDLFTNTRFKELADDQQLGAWEAMTFDEVYSEHPCFAAGKQMPVLLCVGVDKLFAATTEENGKEEAKDMEEDSVEVSQPQMFSAAARTTYMPLETPGGSGSGGGFGIMAVPRSGDEPKDPEDSKKNRKTVKPKTKAGKAPTKVRDKVEINHASLMSVLMWPGDEERSCVSLYTGGDAEDPQENNLLRWLDDGGCKKVTTVKAGHHGSQYGTTLKWATEDFEVDRWIISAGEKDAHPTWQVLAFLFCYFLGQEAVMDTTDGTLQTPLMATRIPYWMTRDSDGKMLADFLLSPYGVAYIKSIEAKYGSKDWLKALVAKSAAGKDDGEKAANNLKFAAAVNGTMSPLWQVYGQPSGVQSKKQPEFRGRVDEIRHIRVTSWPSAFESDPPKPFVNKSRLAKGAEDDDKKRERVAKAKAKRRNTDPDVLPFDKDILWNADMEGQEADRKSRTDTPSGVAAKEVSRKRMITRSNTRSAKYPKTEPAPEEKEDDEEEEEEYSVESQSQSFRMVHASLTAPPQSPNSKSSDPLSRFLTYFSAYYREEASSLVADGQLSSSTWGEVAKPQTEPATKTLAWLNLSLRAAMLTLSGSVDVDKSPVVDSVAVELRITKTYPLIFTTSRNDFTRQFGRDEKPNKDGSFDLGISAYVPGQIFSLQAKEDTSKSPPAPLPTLRDLWAFLECDGFPKWVVTLFGGLTLQTDMSEGARNFFLFQPQMSDLTVIRLQMKLADFGAIKKLLEDWFGSSPIQDVTVVGRKTVSSMDLNKTDMSVQKRSTIMIKTDFNWELHNSDDPKAVPESFSCSTIIAFHNGGFNFIIQLPDKLHFKALLIWVSNKLKAAAGGEDIVNKDIRDSVGDALDNLAGMIMPRQFTISVGAKNQIMAFQVDFEIPLNFGAPQGTKVLLAASFSWSPGQFRFNGSLWDKSLPPELTIEDERNLPVHLNPFQDPFLEITPITPRVFDPPNTTKIIDYISLAHINPHEELTIPSWLPSMITDATVEISFGTISGISFRGTLQAPAPDPGAAVPIIWLEELDLSASITFAPKKTFEFRLEAVVKLQPRGSSTSEPAQLDAVISHSSTGAWSLRASATDLDFGHLYELFDPDGQQEAVMNFMENFYVPEIHIEYSFADDQPSSFEIGGSIIIGRTVPIQLDLTYNHYGKASKDAESSWRVQAILSEGKWADEDDEDRITEVTVGHLLEDIISEEDVATLPEYITKMTIPLSELSIEIDCRRPEDNPDMVVFCLDVGFVDFHFSLVQIQNHKLLTPGNLTAKPVRMLRLAMTKLPEITSVPIITALEQPFDQMDFIWLSGDLTRQEVDILNDTIYTGRGEPLMFKAAAAPASSGTPGEEIVGEAGCHFQIIIKENDQPNVILDYVFGRPKKTPANNGNGQPAAKGMLMAAVEETAPPAATSTEGNGDTAAAPVTKSFGSLSIKNIGLSLKGQVLSISLDATAILGPIGFSLLGFTLDIDLSQIKSVEHMFGHVSIHGLSLQFNQPPVTIAGLFKVLPGPGIGYAGGVVLNVEPWSFMAAGAYEDKDGYKSVFIFAKLNGPLIELEFAEISGITGGFGYNSELRFPKASEIMAFAFVSISQPGAKQPDGQTPMEQLNALVDTTGTGWISRRQDSIWLAAGLEIKALQVIEVQAVLAVDISPNPKIGLIAEAAFVMPPEVPPAEQVVFVDLGLTAVIEPTLGTLQVTGELTPRSYILHPSCKLSGGFAMCYWFKGSGHEGDWVFSVGGYHPAYKPPAHYPVPPRLAIKWQYDANLFIGGQAYFAITPAMCMAGGRLDAVFKKGNLDASFSAHADLLIKYKPFYFRADMGVTVRAGYVMGTGKLKNRVGGSASADLSLWGPPMAGMATVSFWFVDFDVYFGPRSSPSQALTLAQVDEMLRNETTGRAAAQGKAAAADDNGEPVIDAQSRPGHTLAVTSGSVVQQAADEMNVDVLAEEPWLVRGPTLVFEVHSRFPLSLAESNKVMITKHVEGDPDWDRSFSSKPMEQAGLNMYSTLHLSYERPDGSSAGLLPLQAEAIVKQVPTALWEKYQDETDPLKGSRALLSTTKQTMPHIMGLRIRPPKSTITQDNIPVFDTMQFNMIDVNLNRPPATFPRSGVANPNFAGRDAEGGDDRERLEEISEAIADERREKRRNAVAEAFTTLFGGQALQAGTPERYLRTMEEEWRVAPSVTVR